MVNTSRSRVFGVRTGSSSPAGLLSLLYCTVATGRKHLLIFQSKALGPFWPGVDRFLQRKYCCLFIFLLQVLWSMSTLVQSAPGHCKSADSKDEVEESWSLFGSKWGERKERNMSSSSRDRLCSLRLRETSSSSCGESLSTWSVSPTTVAAWRNASPCTPATTRSWASLWVWIKGEDRNDDSS